MRLFLGLLMFAGGVPIGKDQSFPGSKFVAGVERAIAKLSNQVLLLLDFVTFIDEYRLDPVAVCSDANHNPKDCRDADQVVKEAH